ncbi:cytochrome P450 [Streptomyces sp. NBC_01217]|uniref:cytochrome P450 n=1 Tax=Streptomyces sp. NBC_01217 TaxID=2903779 RepID=UPI002E0DE832|nr:cytochrome P450 [Streptomyces sp. NBC_01217]
MDQPITSVEDRTIAAFDSHDPALSRNPYPTYEQLRSRCPVTWSPSWGGFWMASGHAEVASAGRDKAFSTGQVLPDGTLQGVTIPPLGQTGRLVPLEQDAPESIKYRRLLASFYSAGRVRERLPELRRLARESVDAVISDGSCDIVQALTLRVPAIVTMRDIGLPDERWAEVDALLHKALLAAPHDMAAARAHGQEITLEILEQVEQHREDGTGGGLIPHLLAATVDGRPVDDGDILSILYLLLLGIDPTSTLTATALLHLTQDQKLRKRLTSDPSLIPQAADEFLRWMSPVQGTSRTVTTDTSLGGTTLRPGERVFLSWAAANRDPSAFAEPDAVLIDRENRDHLAFGAGPHYCLGAALVRAMFSAMLEQVLTRMPDYVVADPDGISYFPDLSSVYGVTALPLTYTPGEPTRITDPE